MNILVAGGAGFIGSNLCYRLLNGGHEVYCLDNFHTGQRSNVQMIADLNNRFHVINIDITRSDFYIPHYEYVRFDHIYNLASPTSPKHCKEKPTQTLLSNIVGTSNLLKLAKEQGSKFLQASTIWVYERTSIDYVNAAYLEGKKGAEVICSEYKSDIDLRVVRLTSVYGPGMSITDSRVIPQFIMKALRNEDLTIFGGSQLDYFCYVADMVNILIHIMDTSILRPIILAPKEMISIRSLAELIIELTYSKSKIIEVNSTTDIQSRSTLPGDHFYKWEPLIDMRKGLQYTIDYYKECITVGDNQ